MSIPPIQPLLPLSLLLPSPTLSVSYSSHSPYAGKGVILEL